MPMSGYEASLAEIQNVIMDWALAAEGFRQRYTGLTELINSLEKNKRIRASVSRERMQRLRILRQHSTDALLTLMLDMSGQRAGRSSQLSKPGQLHSHARMLNELNRAIDAELTTPVTTVAQA